MNGYSRRNFIRFSSTLLLGTAFPLFRSFSNSKIIQIHRAAYTMGSIATITAYSTDAKACELAIDEAFREMKLIDRLMSVFNQESQLSLVNQSAGKKEVAVDFRIIEVIEHAQRIHAQTNGAFDVTIEPLMELYGFRDEKSEHSFPSDKQIAQTLDSIGMRNVLLDKSGSTVILTNEHTRIDFGGIAVGYAIDRAVRILKAHGIESALINHSGDLYALGSPLDEDTWEIGITDPKNTDKIITTVGVKNQALCTSGNYRNFITSNGKQIGHILNPSNGRSANSILSGTTIAATAIDADAFSTGFFVLGTEKSRHILRTENLQFIAVVDNGDGEKILYL